ncbi:esterase/lipase family protein [Haloferula helveola]|uniref:esterase/lipase family protein n=1 Tax=Haloferula helveola TaxID=490095 RepID=UPI0030CDC908
MAPISVHEGTANPAEPKTVSVEKLMATADSEPDPMTAAGRTLDALRVAARAVVSGKDSAIPEYNYLTGRLIDHLIAAGVSPWQKSLEVESGSTRYLLRGTEPADLKDPGRTFVTCDRLSFTGRYAREEAVSPGIGAPLVAFLSKNGQNLRKKQLPYRSVTAVVRFNGNEATVDLLDPYESLEVRVGGRTLPLKADFGSNIAYGLSKERIDKLGLARLINPSRYDDTARLLMVQPYDPDRIPVLFVHGLQDTPASFAPMYFDLMADPAIREKYQFWAFSYPSGYPYPMPASLLREQLDEVAALHPGHKDIVIIGHSMGGLISRLMVTDVGDGIWRSMFGTAPSETSISGYSRELLEDSLLFNARNDIDRAIFISAPHRGSELATNIIGWIGVKLVRFPSTLADLRNTLVTSLSLDASGFQLDRFPSSIDTLSPTNRFVRLINEYPIRSTIPYHTIVGDRGKGDTPDSSDGVVAYWSSHLDGAVSEKVVPSDHSAHQHPEGIEEVRRILHLHAGIPYRANRNLEAPPEKEPFRPLGRPHGRR